ncbi:hypothetical protein HPP92_022405 [Vanilla planifolia]|uniref:HSF-type DNA-binding domain-containing protein n=1 Tax=Vanilla planifolia TaxID=51239 RepID=A0A835PX23_VANPL|nr:hypothetical protein HPP92_022714 [Vanilla planifolia]KAG0459277.1 hypothetical protein HPP92_022405 [Vanilla planifolia]
MVKAMKGRSCDGVALSKQRRKNPAPFVSKTYDLVEGSDVPHLVSWSQEGTSFVVWSPRDFARIVLPRFFRHCKFSSFVRQLNIYGFRKCAPDRWEFKHEKFQRGRRHQVAEIMKRKRRQSDLPSFLQAGEKCTSDAERMELMQENRNLQKERAELLFQIRHYSAMKEELHKRFSQTILYLGKKPAGVQHGNGNCNFGAIFPFAMQ